MLLLQQAERQYILPVAEQEVKFTVRPAIINDMDLAYAMSRVTALDGVSEQVNIDTGNLRASRSLLLQRIIAWEGVYLSETEAAPCTLPHLSAFFGQYPRVFIDLAEKVRQDDEAAEKN